MRRHRLRREDRDLILWRSGAERVDRSFRASGGDHEQIARYYEAKADWYRARAQEHAVMLAYFMANNATNNEKTRFSTVNHCEYLFRSLNQRARAAHRRAVEQEQMAQTSPAE